MKIALFPSSFHPHVGGVEQMVRQLSHELARQGDAPFVISNRWPKTLAACENVEGLTVRRFLFRIPERYWRQYGGAILFGRSTLRNLCSELEKNGTDLIHAHCVSSNVHYALAASKRLGIPLVVTLHAELSMDAGGWFQSSKFARRLMHRAVSEADAVTACSARTLRDAEAYVGHKLDASVILNGTDPAEFATVVPYQHPRPYLLAMGRLVRQKGLDLLIRAYVRARSLGKLAFHDLLIAGEGSERAALELLSTELGGGDGRIKFVGRVDRAAALSLIRGCAFYALPSRGDEGLPMVLLEAMSAGRAAVAFAVGGVPELIADGQTGRLVPPGNVEAFAAALAWMSEQHSACDAMGTAAANLAKKFAWPLVAAQYRDVYAKVLGISTEPRS